MTTQTPEQTRALKDLKSACRGAEHAAIALRRSIDHDLKQIAAGTVTRIHTNTRGYEEAMTARRAAFDAACAAACTRDDIDDATKNFCA